MLGEGKLGSTWVKDAGSLPEAADPIVSDGGFGDAVQQVVGGCVGRSCSDDYFFAAELSCPRIDGRRRELGLAGAGRTPDKNQSVISRERHRMLLLVVGARHFSCIKELLFGRRLHVPDRADPGIRPMVVVIVVGRVPEAFARQCVMVTLRSRLP